jgi:hypothetical protein
VIVQSALVQQVLLAMQEFDAVQVFSPPGQPQVPPKSEQIWPVTVQSAVVQQVALPMHEFEGPQSF